MIGESRLLPWLVVFAAGWMLYLLAPILTPFVASALLAYLGDPLVDRLERLRMPRSLAVLVVFVLIFFVLALLTLLVLPLVQVQGAALAAKLPVYVEWAEQQLLPQVREWLGKSAGEAELGLGGLLSSHTGEVGSFAGKALLTVSRSGTAVIGILANLFLIPIITFYLMRDWDVMIASIDALVPERYQKRVALLAGQTDDALAGFLRGQLTVMMLLALIYCVGLWLLGLDFALAIGTIAGLVSFVPYLGLIVGIALAGLAALAQLQSVAALAGVVAVFVVGQLIEGTVLTPKLVGDRIGLHPVLVIFAVMAGGTLFGFFGILIALPAAAVVSVLVRFVYAHYSQPATAAAAGDDAHPGPDPAEAAGGD